MNARIICVIALLGVIIAHTVQSQSVDSLLLRYKSEPDSAAQRILQLQLAWQYQTQGDFARAIAFYKKAAADETLAPAERLPLLRNMSFCYGELGDVPGAIEVERTILELHRSTSQPYEVIENSLQRLAVLYLQLKDYQNSISFYQEILEGAKKEQRYISIAQACNNLGYIYYLTGDQSRSDEYFNETYKTLSEGKLVIGDDGRATILLNLGVLNANVGRLAEAGQFFMQAYDISVKQDDPIKIAHSMNYLASHEYIQNNLKAALRWADDALEKLSALPPTDLRDATLGQTYRILSEIMFRKNDIKAFRKYNVLYTEQQAEIIQKEKRRNRLFLERQIEVEKTKAEIANLLNEQEKQNLILSRTKIEQEAKQNELLLKNNELQMLRKENELQEEKYRNSVLENQQVNQMLELVAQRSNAEQQQQKIVLLEKEKQLQDLQLEKKKEDIEELRRTQEQDRQIRTYNFIFIGLLFLLLAGAVWLHFYRSKKNKVLFERNDTISRMNQEMITQNQQLMSINDQLQIKSIELHAQNNKLNAAHQMINRQKEELLSYAKNLEQEVMRRTEQIREKGERLSEYTDQMEKFTYAISHNLRAPIARLLGLVNIISPSLSPDELAFFLSKVRESAVQLDDVIKDLSLILELRAEKQHDVELIDLRARINSVLALHGDSIAEISPRIIIDLQEQHIHGIGGLVDSIFYNLIGNSLKFRQPDRDLIIKINSYREGTYIVLRCEDNGIGIDLARHGEKLFGLYKRFEMKIDGKGLGLYLVKSHVNALNGVVTVESSPGKGAVFVIKLPATQTVKAGEPHSENILR